MNYPNLPGGNPSRRPPRNSNFFFLFILGFMAFFLFMQYKKAIGRSNAYRDQAEIKIPDEISFDKPIGTPSATPPQDGSKTDPLKMPWDANGPVGRSTDSDWEVDTNIQTEEATSLVVGSDKGGPPDATTSGDWSLEVSDSTSPPEAAPDFGGQSPAPQAKKTEDGDWELSEVDTTDPVVD